MSVSSSSKWLVIFLFLTLPLFLFSQKKIKNTATQRCHTDQKMQSAMETNLAYKKAIEEDLAKPTTSTFNTFGKNSSVVVTIPVHVIIVHPPGQSIGTGVNFPLDHVESQITVLNEDFRRTNADAGNTPTVFAAADVEIEFCLASVDPSGNPTDGITRYGTNQNLDDNEFAIKSATGWDRDDYLNIWVGPNLGGILGWAYRPTTTTLPNATLDGVVTASTTFGGPGYGTNTPYDLGRTTTHEVGHYLGLRHVWGSGGCSNDDGIADTPIQSSSNFGCPNHPSPSCSNGGDMFMNYMDYVNDNCMNAFTTGQGTWMHDILNTSRSSLLGSAVMVCNAVAPLALQLLDQTNVTCFGGNDGTITVMGSGGSGNYTYSINSGTPQSSNIFSGLSAGTYEVAVNDGANTISMNVTLTAPSEVLPIISTQTDVTCFGENNGSIIVDGAGGTNNGGGYTYSLNNGPFTTNNFFNNLSGGVYTIVVRDELNCEGTTSVFINEPTELLSFVASEISIDCHGNNNGEIVLGSTGGSPNYLYSFDGGGYSSNNIFTNLSQGVYPVATVDGNNCQHSFEVTLVEPSEIQLTVASQTNLSCFGDENGMIEVNGQGGTGNLEYQINGQGYQTSNQFTNLSGGTYNLDVSDENGCMESLSVTITEPAELVVELTNQNNIPCFGGNTGSVTINSNGGVGTVSVAFNGTTTSGNSVTFENLEVGTYPFSVTDENGCMVASSVEIIENPEVILAISNAQNILCNGENNGSIAVQSSGGSGNFTYFLNGISQGNNNTFTSLESGTYTIESIDDEGCSDTETVEITEPTILEGQLSQQTNLNCFGENDGSITVNGSGGTGTLQYTLGSETNTTGEFTNLSAGNYTISILDENNCETSVQAIITQPTEVQVQVIQNTNVDCFGENSGSFEIMASGGAENFEFSNGTETNSTGIFNNLTAGNYTISVTDGNNCETTIQTNITQPGELTTNILTQEDVNCFGENSGMISLEANGGVGNITFTLNGSSNTTGEFPNLNAGSYAVQVVDENNCETTLDFEIDEPMELNIVLQNITQASCTGQEGEIEVSANGGVGNYEFSVGSESNATGIFTGFSGGIYIVEVEDENGCVASIEVDINEPNSLTASISQSQNIDCFGGNTGNVQVNGTGGTGNLIYTLGSETNTTGFFENLTAGNYTISVIDENNCETTIQTNITQPDELTTNILTQEDVDCFGENSGMISLESNGGVGNITFTLNGSSNTTGEFPNLNAGSYAVQVVDENNCETTLDFEIEEPMELNIVLQNITQASCTGQEGEIEVSANGGVGNYEFSVGSESNATGIFTGFSGGIYIVEVEDENGCVANIEVDINEPNSLNATISQSQNIDCFGGNNGNVQVNGTGGTGNLTYTLGSETNTTGFFENLTAGSYNVILEDENNCSSSIDVSISEPTELEIMISNITGVNCYESNDGAVNLASNGGTGTVEYTLGNTTNTTGVFENLPAGIFNVMIEDENGCTDIAEVEINSPTQISTTIVDNQPITCAGETDGMIEILAVGGTGDFEYSFGNETNTNGIFSGISEGTFSFLATDVNGCVEEISFTFDEPQPIEFENIESQNIDCNGNANGMIQLDANGGTGNLTFSIGNETNETGIFENLSQGIFEVIVTDENNCSTSTQVAIEEPPMLEIENENVSFINCFGENNGSLEIIISGGTGAIEYNFGNETNSTGVFANIEAGTYSLTATDENNCSFSQEYIFTEPAQLVPDISQTTPIDCFGSSTGTIQATATGGTGTPIYTLNSISNSTGIFENLPAGTYEILVVDEMDCSEIISITIDEPTQVGLEILSNTNADCAGAANGIVEVQGTNGVGDFIYELNGEINTTGIFGNLAPGMYELVTTDGNGCEIITMIAIAGNSDITVESMMSTDVDCFGNETGTINIIAGSPSGALTYDLNGAINSTGIFENLPSGIYEVIVADVNNCTTTLSFEISEPTEVNLDLIGLTPVDCYGESTGEAMVNGSGGNGGFSYTLNGETNDTGIFTNLPAGIFEIIATDSEGCTQTEVIEIVEPELLVIEVVATTDDTNNGNGTVTFVGSGGTPPFLFSVDGLNFQPGELFLQLPGGNYEGFVLDGNGCIAQVTFTIFMETAVVNLEEGISELDIFPNPFSDQLFLEVDLEIAQELQLTLWNVAGVEIFSKKIELQNGNHRINLEINHQVPAGSYFLKVNNENGSIGYFKLIKY